MGRLNTGGKSMRVDVALPPELHAAAEKAAKDRGVKLSELVRLAIAAYLGQANLAGELKPGRRWPADPAKRKRKKAPAKKRARKA